MTNVLQMFILTLDTHIQEKTYGKKNLSVLRILEEEGIEVPQEVLRELDRQKKAQSQHDSIMESMHIFMGNNIDDFPDGIIVQHEEL